MIKNNVKIVEELRKLVAKDKIDDAVGKLLEFLPNKDKTLYHNAIMSANKNEIIKKNQALGLISNEELGIRKSNLNNLLLFIIDEISQLPDYSLSASTTIDVQKANLLLNRKEHVMEKLGFLYGKIYKTSNPSQEYELSKDIKELEDELANIEYEIKKTH